MSTEITASRRATASLVGDACLLTAVTIPFGPLSLVIGPSVAWYLHGRKLDRYAVMAGLAGLFAGLVVVGGAAVLLGFGLESIGLGGDDYRVPLAILGVAALAFFLALIALDVDAVRDLDPEKRTHARLDVVRLTLSVVLVVATVAVTWVQVANPATEVGDAGVFALIAGAVGAVAMWVANAVYARLEPKKPT